MRDADSTRRHRARSATPTQHGTAVHDPRRWSNVAPPHAEPVERSLLRSAPRPLAASAPHRRYRVEQARLYRQCAAPIQYDAAAHRTRRRACWMGRAWTWTWRTPGWSMHGRRMPRRSDLALRPTAQLSTGVINENPGGRATAGLPDKRSTSRLREVRRSANPIGAPSAMMLGCGSACGKTSRPLAAEHLAPKSFVSGVLESAAQVDGGASGAPLFHVRPHGRT